MTGAALVLQGDARRLPLPDASVDLAISSPPYFNLRAYGAGPGEIGAERTPAEFLQALWEVTAELVRVVKPTGSIFINLGDSYARPGGGADVSARSLNGAGKGATARRPSPNRPGVREKSLLGLPWAYALGCTGMLAALGGPDPGLNLILRAPIVLHKINGLPESVRDRVRTSDQEMLFHLVKQPRYYSAIDELREPSVTGGRVMFQSSRGKGKGLPLRGPSDLDTRLQANNPLGKLPGSVWSMASEPLRLPEWLGVNHYAAFSSELPRRVILAFSPPGICVECGQGRVPVVERTGRVVASDGRDQYGAYSERRGRGETSGPQRQSGNGGGTASMPRHESTILGYACSCTPHTDHPGSGEQGGWGSYDDAGLSGAPAPNGKQHVPGNYKPKVGPWREYHLDRWTAPPTRPAVILDPFAGTFTTVMVARALNRIGVGIDLSASYCKAGRWRVYNDGAKAISRTNLDRQGTLL